MALIFADDFQQLAKNTHTASGTNNTGPGATALYIADTFEALGFRRPYTMLGAGVYWSSVAYNTTDGCLRFADRSESYTYYQPNADSAAGLKRDIVVKGDTFFLNMRWASSNGFWYTNRYAGPFLSLNDGLFTVSLNVANNYVLNGVDTGVQALYEVEITQHLELIVGPDYVELWAGDNLVQRQNIATVPVTNFQICFPKPSALDSTSSAFKLYSLIVADNSGTDFNTRIGRKLVKSVALTAIPSTQSTLETYSTTTMIQTLQTPMQTLDLDIHSTRGFGNVYSKLPFVKTSLTGAVGTPTKVYAAAINIQAKRRELSNDGMGVLPYIKLVSTEEYGPVFVPRARWKAANIPMAITPNLTVNNIEFGFMHDYAPSTAKIYADDRSNVEVYGEPTPAIVVLPFQTYVPTMTNIALQTPTYSAYVFDYAKSDLNIANTPVNNLTYYQDV